MTLWDECSVQELEKHETNRSKKEVILEVSCEPAGTGGEVVAVSAKRGKGNSQEENDDEPP